MMYDEAWLCRRYLAVWTLTLALLVVDRGVANEDLHGQILELAAHALHLIFGPLGPGILLNVDLGKVRVQVLHHLVHLEVPGRAVCNIPEVG